MTFPNSHNYAYGIKIQLDIQADEGAVRIGPTHCNTLSEVGQVISVVARAIC